jgi:hypothetical protein
MDTDGLTKKHTKDMNIVRRGDEGRLGCKGIKGAGMDFIWNSENQERSRTWTELTELKK